MKKSKSVIAKNYSLLTPLIIAGLATLVISYNYFSTPRMQPQKIDINLVNNLGYAGLVITPTGTIPSSGFPLSAKTPMKIVLDGGTRDSVLNKVVATTVELSFDPTKMIISDVAIGTHLTNIFSTPSTKIISPTNHTITFSYGVPPADGGKTGSGTLVTFNVEPLVSGPMLIKFGVPTEVRAEGIADNILVTSPDYTITGKPIMILADLDIKTGVVTVQTDNISEKTDIVNLYKLATVGSPIVIPATATKLNWVYDNNTKVLRTTEIQPSPYLTLATTPTQVSAAGTFVVSYTRKLADGTYKVIDTKVVSSLPRVNSDIVYDMNVADDVVNAQDYAQFVADFNKTNAVKGWIRSDINSDGAVNIADYPTFVREWSL